MSVFSKLGSFVKTVAADFEKIWSKTPTVMQVISQGVGYVQPILVALFGMFDPAAEPEVADILNESQAAFATVKTIASSATPQATDYQTAETALNTLKTNLSGLLNAAQVKNSANASKITADTDLIVGELDAMLNSISTATSSGSAGSATAAA